MSVGIEIDSNLALGYTIGDVAVFVELRTPNTVAVRRQPICAH